MRKEWNGALVGRDEFEPKHPQLGPFRSVVDAQAIKDARPARKEPFEVYVGVPTVEKPTLKPLVSYAKVESVEVNIS
jgi:hypothetical protein